MLHFIFRNSDDHVFFLPSLRIGAGHADVNIIDGNQPPADTPYVCVVTVWDFWRLDPAKCAEHGVPHFSKSIEQRIILDIAAGRAILVLDLTNEGPGFERWAFDRLHDVIDAWRIPADRVVWLAQNRVISTAYEAAYRSSRERLIRFEYYDFYIKLMAHFFADEAWRHHTMGDETAYRRKMTDPAEKDRIALCLNATPRQHRLYAVAALKHYGLFDDSLVSFGGLGYDKGGTTGDQVVTKTELDSEFSWLSGPMRWVAGLPKIDVDAFEETGNSLWNKIDVNPYLRSFVSLVTETDFSAGGIERLTEKTIKAFCLGHPVIALGNPHSIKTMAQWGFQAFEGSIDQSYDIIAEPGPRFRQVFAELLRQATSIRVRPSAWLDTLRQSVLTNLDHSQGAFLQTYRRCCDRVVIGNLERLLTEIAETRWPIGYRATWSGLGGWRV